MKKLLALFLTASLSFSVAAFADNSLAEPLTQTPGVNLFVRGTRQAEVRDIVITEKDAGLFKKNKNIYLRADHLQFEDNPTVEITQGDVKVKEVKADGDTLIVKIDKESTEASVITLKDVRLYLEDTLPQGVYPLDLVTEESDTYPDNIFGANYGDNDEKGKFSTASVELMSDFAKIGIAENKTINQLTINIGKKDMLINSNTVAASQEPYISNDNYVMVPLRALNEVFPDEISIKWDDATKTATIIVFGTMKTGDKIANIKIGSSSMDVNGTPVPMQGKAEIKNGSVFLPLRDFGYLIGCDETDIVYNADEGTAVLTAGKVGK